jgi:hypothetical protein
MNSMNVFDIQWAGQGDSNAVPLPTPPSPLKPRLWEVNRELTFELVDKTGARQSALPRLACSFDRIVLTI